jgi:MFS transporter, putative metabolite:H+ symporter
MSPTGPELAARLDRLKVWPYPMIVIWVVGIGYFMSFFDITNVAFGLPVFGKLFHLSQAQEAYPISASLFGYILGAWINGNLADFVGRKRGIAFATILFSGGCLGATFSNDLLTMVIWRFVTGMGIGAEIAIVSTYIGELAPSSMRGRYTALVNVFSFVGLALVPIVALWLVPNFLWGWRVLYLVGALGILTLPGLLLLPESPRWLLGKQRYAEAEAIIVAAERRALPLASALVAPTALTATPLPPVRAAAAEAKSAKFPSAELFHAPYLGRLSLLLGMWFLFYTGEYIWLGLGPTFFVDRGYTLSHSIMFMLMSSIGLPLGALVSAWLADRFERKHSVFIGMAAWAIAFVVIAFVTNVFVIYGCVFVLALALGFVMPLMYTLTNESFPTSARSTGVSLTDGLGHLGGAVGPVVATTVYTLGGTQFGFSAVFVLIAATALAAAIPMLFSIDATRQTLGGAKPLPPIAGAREGIG